MTRPDETTPDATAFHRDGLLEGQPALVTGASSGIGYAVALELARAGCDVAINYSSHAQPAEELAHRIVSMGRRAMAVKADVSREDDVVAMFERAIAQFGTLHVVVSNAGLQRDAPLTEMTLDEWNGVIGVNLTGQFLCGRQAAREFKRRGVVPNISKAAGKIICMSSVHDVIPWAGHANYAASKGGISALMKTMAQELAPSKVRVNAISPGAIRTPINREAWSTPEAYADLMTLVPYGRIGEPSDIGAAAVWLASDAADYITGTTLYVDGGMTLYPGFTHGG
ncbi:MAG: SDR family oxidoreductase [Beijerinckiaceae bacterium]|nr:SDR family oxidoreductase [Beijerinckiaceae bacterium]